MFMTSLVAQTVTRLPTVRETRLRPLGQEDLLKGMATHSSILAPPHPKKGAQRNIWVSPVAQTVKCLSAMRETWVLPRVGKIPGEGYGNPLSYSCLENSMD